MNSEDTREEIQTLERFILNQGEFFFREKVIQDRIQLNEPADLSYEGVEYQITYGDTKQLGKDKAITKKMGKLIRIRRIERENYAQVCLKDALENKNRMSGRNITLLIDCTSTSYESLKYRERLCKNYFDNYEPRLEESWEHIFVVFLDGNVQLC